MASTLTERQRQTLFVKCLEIPYSADGFREIDDTGTVVTLQAGGTAGQVNSALGQVSSFLDAMSSGTETELKSKLDAVYDLGLDNIAISNGSFGSISGIEYSSKDERENHIKEIKGLVPFFRHHEQLCKSARSEPWLPIMG